MASSTSSGKPETPEDLYRKGWHERARKYGMMEFDWDFILKKKKSAMCEEFFEMLARPEEDSEVKAAKDKFQGDLQRIWDDIEKNKFLEIQLHAHYLNEHTSVLQNKDDSELNDNPSFWDRIMNNMIEVTTGFFASFIDNPKFSTSSFANIDSEHDEKLNEMMKSSVDFDNFENNPNFLKYKVLTENWEKVAIQIVENEKKIQSAQKLFENVSEKPIGKLKKIQESRELDGIPPGSQQEKISKLNEKILKLDLLENHKSIDKLMLRRLELLNEKGFIELLIVKSFPSQPSNSPTAVVYETMIEENFFKNLVPRYAPFF